MKFYTSTASDASDKYQVCAGLGLMLRHVLGDHGDDSDDHNDANDDNDDHDHQDNDAFLPHVGSGLMQRHVLGDHGDHDELDGYDHKDPCFI